METTNATDLFALAWIFISFIQGFRKGIFRSLVTPLSLGISMIVAVIHLDVTDNIGETVAIVTFGTAFLTILFKLALWIGRRGMDKDFKNYVFFGSRLAGCIINTIWNSLLAFVVMIVIVALPSDIFNIYDLQENIQRSTFYSLSQEKLINPYKRSREVYAALTSTQNAAYMKELSESPQVQAFAQHPKIQALTNDPQINRYIQEKESYRILTNPKFVAVIGDDDLMAVLTKICKRVLKDHEEEPDSPSDFPATPALKK
jgi:hypothetical protein